MNWPVTITQVILIILLGLLYYWLDRQRSKDLEKAYRGVSLGVNSRIHCQVIERNIINSGGKLIGKRFKGLVIYSERCYINTLYTTPWGPNRNKVMDEIISVSDIFKETLKLDPTNKVSDDREN